MEKRWLGCPTEENRRCIFSAAFVANTPTTMLWPVLGSSDINPSLWVNLAAGLLHPILRTFMSNNSFSAQAIMTSFCFPSTTYAAEKFWLCGGLISPLLIGPQITNYVGDTSMSSQFSALSKGIIHGDGLSEALLTELQRLMCVINI